MFFTHSEIRILTGLPRPTLLSWERRFGWPLPQRDERGHRRYSRGQLRQLEQVVALLAELNAKRAATAVTSLPEGVDLDATLTAAGVEMVDWQQLDPAHAADVMYDVDVGITDVHAALAETGTLICRSDAAHPRALSLIPTVHVAIVQAADILPDMIDYWAQLRDTPGPPSSSTAFITGPSKTADIEGQLVQGVHGPEQVYILLVRAT